MHPLNSPIEPPDRQPSLGEGTDDTRSTQEVSRAGYLRRLAQSRRATLYAAVTVLSSAVAGSADATAQACANAPAAAGPRQPVLVAAANNNPPRPPLQRPHLDADGMQQILADAANGDEELANALAAPEQHRKSIDAHRTAAAALLERAADIDMDPAHAEQLWAFIAHAYRHARHANDLDLMYRSLGYQRHFGIPESQIIANKVQSFLHVLDGTKKNSPVQVALVRFELFELMSDAFDADLYKLVSDLYTKGRPILDKAGMKGESTLAKQLSLAALKVQREFSKLDAQLQHDPEDPKANLDMGTFYALKKGSWRRALECFLKGDDQELAQLSRDFLDSDLLFSLGARLQPQDVDHLVDLAQAWAAYGDAHRNIKQAAYEAAATCYLAMKDAPNNNAQRAAAVAFLGRNKQKPIDLAKRADPMRGVELPAKSIDLLTQLNTESFFSGWGHPIIQGQVQKDMVSHSYRGMAGHTLFPLDMDGDYILELQLLLGPQPDYQTHEADYFHIGIPLKDHMVMLSMNEPDALGLFAKGMKLGGLSLVDGRKFPAGAVYEDSLMADAKPGVPLNVRIKVSFRGNLADITYMRSNGLRKEWTVDIDKCHADKMYQGKDGRDLRGLIVGSRSGIRIHEMWLHSMDSKAEVRKVDPNQQAVEPNN